MPPPCIHVPYLVSPAPCLSSTLTVPCLPAQTQAHAHTCLHYPCVPLWLWPTWFCSSRELTPTPTVLDLTRSKIAFPPSHPHTELPSPHVRHIWKAPLSIVAPTHHILEDFSCLKKMVFSRLQSYRVRLGNSNFTRTVVFVRTIMFLIAHAPPNLQIRWPGQEFCCCMSRHTVKAEFWRSSGGPTDRSW